MPFATFYVNLSRTKTLQMVTLQVKISFFFFVLENFGAGVSKNMVGNCALNFDGVLPVLNLHLQCYRLRCFSFARSMGEGNGKCHKMSHDVGKMSQNAVHCRDIFFLLPSPARRPLLVLAEKNSLRSAFESCIRTVSEFCPAGFNKY